MINSESTRGKEIRQETIAELWGAFWRLRMREEKKQLQYGAILRNGNIGKEDF